MEEYKNYIRVNGNGHIIKSFSTAFEQPIEGDIEIVGSNKRHYNLDLFREDGLPRLKYSGGVIIETVNEDLTVELQIRANDIIKVELENLDRTLQRSVEDIINLLVAKGLIAIGDLPQEIISAKAQKEALRQQLI